MDGLLDAGIEKGLITGLLRTEGAHPASVGWAVNRWSATIPVFCAAKSATPGAACLAATHPGLIQKIRDKLPRDTELSDKACTFWALLKGSYSDPRRLLEPDNVIVEGAGTLPRAL
jgi:hypothetical protein